MRELIVLRSLFEHCGAAAVLAGLLLTPVAAHAAGGTSILDYAGNGNSFDTQGHGDASDALSAAVAAANLLTGRGEPACVLIPAGRYHITRPPPPFVRAGCVKGEGPTQSILQLDRGFAGDLFAWSEAWAVTTPGPTITGLKIIGDRTAPVQQNALVFYDRNDDVFIDQVEVDELPGRALYSGATRAVSKAFMRESHLRSLRFFDDGLRDAAVVEFSSAGDASSDATNEIRLSQVDIYGARGPSFVIRNAGQGHVRAMTVEALRIEGKDDGDVAADLLTVGDPTLRGNVNTITFTDLELIDPYRGYAALRLTAAPGAEAPYQINVQGWIGGGAPHGEGLRIDAGRSSIFRFAAMHTEGVNVSIAAGVSQVLLDGGGRERCWSITVDPRSARGVMFPVFVTSDRKESGAC